MQKPLPEGFIFFRVWELEHQYVIFAPGKPARPAPAELPQDRKVARVGGCSGAMFGLPFFYFSSVFGKFPVHPLHF
jgi:hypothetical protein